MGISVIIYTTKERARKLAISAKRKEEGQ